MSLKQTKNCECNNEIIKNKANEFKVEGDLVSTAKNIFTFVQYQIGYEDYSNSKKSALKLLNEYNENQKYGRPTKANCCDQAHLLVALFRAAQIPTNYVHGDAHWWACAYIGKEKYECDPTNKKHGFGNPQHGNKHKKKTYHEELDH